jgi:peptide/nickel transport system ATP-binding protein
MQQRVMIAMCLILEPQLVIADEPTTALDVTIQAQVLDLMLQLHRKDSGMIFITHDMGVVAETCDQVAVMYAGRIVEYGTLADIFTGEDHHPYTIGLFGSIPSTTKKTKRLTPIEGLMPDPTALPEGCAFAPRCNYCREICRQKSPQPVTAEGGHMIRCHRAGEKLAEGSDFFENAGEDVQSAPQAADIDRTVENSSRAAGREA